MNNPTAEYLKQAKIVELLVAAKRLIDTPDKWTTKVSARDAYGAQVVASHPRACKFCSIGALGAVSERLGACSEEAVASENALQRQLPAPYIWLAAFNDAHTHAEVMKLWDRAIAAEQGKLADLQTSGNSSNQQQ